MLRAYEDILKRITDAPMWWDDNGVPRFDPFSPDMLGVYIELAALVDIACQSCHKRFNVAFGTSRANLMIYGEREWDRGLPRPTVEPAWFHYGDPPRHGCVGDTMNCDDLRVIEYWTRDLGNEWARHPAEEVPLLDHPDFKEPEPTGPDQAPQDVSSAPGDGATPDGDPAA